MTVNTTKITSGPYIGTGVADTFSYTFKVADKTQLSVYETDDNNNQVLLTVDTDYTVNNVGNDGGGTITRISGALPSDYQWYIRSNYQETQLTAFSSQGPFFPEVHEDAMDKLTLLIQQLLDTNDRSPRLPDSYSGPLPLTLDQPLAGFALRWNGGESGLENYDPFSTISNDEIASDKVVINYSGLLTAVNDPDLKLNQACNVKERTTGNGGGGMWDVVLASTVSTNGENIVACVGVPTLALVLRNTDYWDKPATVALLKSTDLTLGMYAETQGYYDGWAALAEPTGNGRYLIQTLQQIRDALSDPAWVPDEKGDHTLNNGKVAKLQITNVANVTQYGARNDKGADVSASFQACVDANRKVFIPDGEYLWSATVNLVGNRQIEFSQGAILRPGANNFTMLKHENAIASGSNILIENMFASDFGGTATGVTMIQLGDLGPGIEIKSPKATKIDTMIDITENSFGVKIFSPSAFMVPYPIKAGSIGSVGTVDVYSPNFDNSVAVAGGSGLGIGIDFQASGSVYGGYIQGFDSCVKFGGRGTVHATYFESANNEAILFDGAFGVTVINPFFFGFEGDAFFRGRNSEGISIRNPVMVNSGATTGIFDFDNTCKGCTYEFVTNSAETINPIIGITTGISPNTLYSNSTKATTVQKLTMPLTTPTACFRLDTDFPSSTSVTVDINAIERTGQYGTVTKKFNFVIRSGATNTISSINELADYTVKTLNANYEIDAVVTVVEVSDKLFEVSIEVTSQGVITPSDVDLRANIEVTTSTDSVNVWEV